MELVALLQGGAAMPFTLLPTAEILVYINISSTSYLSQDILNHFINKQSGEGGSEPKITEVPGACHKRFRTQDQAQAFIEDWKQALADVYREAIKTALDKGFRQSDLKLSVESFPHETQREIE